MKIMFYNINDETLLTVTSVVVPRKGETIAILGRMYEIAHVRWITDLESLRDVEILVR